MTLVLLLALAAAPPPATAVEPRELHFAAVLRPDAPLKLSPPQVVFLERDGEDVPWTLTTDREWLRVSARQGTAPTTLLVDVPPAAVRTIGKTEGRITLTFGRGGDAVTTSVRVTLDVVSQGAPPVGAFDQPADGTVIRGGALRLSGWALDDIGLASVEVCRDPLPRSAPRETCAGGLMRLGGASFYDAPRPDVAAVVPPVPHRDRGGWTFVLDGDALPRAGKGTFRVHVVAADVDGHTTVLGSKTITVEPSDDAGFPFRPLALLLGPALLLAAAVHFWLRSRGSRLPAAARSGELPAPSSVRWPEAGAIAAIVLLAAVVQLPALRTGLGHDELYTFQRFVSEGSLWKAASTVGVFNNHIAYSLLATVSVRAFGASEWALRLPSLLLGAGAVFFLWRFARAFAGPGTALLSALLLAMAPMHVTWSRSARGYAGLALMAIVSSHYFFTLLRMPSRGGAVGHALTTVVALYFHMYGVWVAVIQYCVFAVLVLRKRLGAESFTRLWRSFAAVVILAAALYSPVAVDLMDVSRTRGRTALQPGFPGELFEALSGVADGWLQLAAAALLGLGVVRLRKHPLHLTYCALLLLIPFAVAWLVLRPHDLYPRFFEYWMPFYCLLTAAAVMGAGTRIRRRESILVIAGAVMVVVLLKNWVGRDLQPAPASAYRATLTGAPAPANARAFVVGADADILAFYLPRPAVPLESADDLERVMRHARTDLTIAYHDVDWNSAEHQRMAALMTRRCRSSGGAPARLFSCRILVGSQ